MTTSPLDQIVGKLRDGTEAERRQAAGELAKLGSLETVTPLFRAWRLDTSPKVREKAWKALEKVGAVVDLTAIGADGWFDRIGESFGAFSALCEVVGSRFVAYAIIAGVQITSLTVDKLTPANTIVEFKVDEAGPVRSMLLPDFRRQLVSWIVSDTPPAGKLELPLDMPQAQRLIGVRFLLLAPLYGYSLRKLVLETGEDAPLGHVVALNPDEDEETIEVGALQARLREEVRRELATVRDVAFHFDLGLIDQVDEAYEKEDWEEVINQIGAWPGPLSMLLRTPAGAALDGAQRGKIGRGLRMLGGAYRRTGRPAWSEELYRLGLQYVSEGTEGAELFSALGSVMMEGERHGEAVGVLRRALTLGSPMEEIGPMLGTALLRRGLHVAAAVVLEQSRLSGARGPWLLPTLRQAYDALGSGSRSWREIHDDWTSDRELASALPPLEDEPLMDDFDPDDRTDRAPHPFTDAGLLRNGLLTNGERIAAAEVAGKGAEESQADDEVTETAGTVLPAVDDVPTAAEAEAQTAEPEASAPSSPDVEDVTDDEPTGEIPKPDVDAVGDGEGKPHDATPGDAEGSDGKASAGG